MGAETWIPIACEFGIPAAFAVCFMAALGFIGWQAIKAVKWIGDRLFGDAGIITTWFAKQSELIDNIQRNDDRSTYALTELTESTRATTQCLEKLAQKEDSHIQKSWQKWDEIHTDVKKARDDTAAIRRKVE